MNYHALCLPLALGGLLAGAPVFASAAEDGQHAHDDVVEEVIVWGRAETQKGTALSASEGLVGYADFETRPLERVGELLEVVPGMVVTQHSGEGKANQYFLRGMNLDHGTDFSAFFEGMPVNFRAHAHGQGYLDLNFLIPEIISTVQYAKGPYHADRGDFSTAGTTTLSLYDRLDNPFIELTGGSDNYQRLVTAGSLDLRDSHMLGALEISRNDGPWTLESEVEKTNALLKYGGHVQDFDTKLILSYYDNEWRSTDQIPERSVKANTIDRFDFIDPSLGGESTRVTLIAGIESDRLNAGFYVSRYKLNLFQNFTYFLDDPVNGDQVEQVDRRWIYGGSADYSFDLGARNTLRIGGDFRVDDISDADLYRTTRRQRRQTVRNDDLEWLSIGGFAELHTQWTERLRSTLGLRGDYYDYDVTALNPLNSGDDHDEKIIPSVNLAFSLNDYYELYANWGEGFHSNDARGATISVDPVTGDPVDAIDIFVDQKGAELGLRFEGWRGLSSTLTYFWLESDSELLFAGDSGSTEPSDASERTGVEFSAFWNLNHNWTFDMNASFVDSEFVDVPSAFDHIPNAQDQVIGAGITYTQTRGWTASLRMRHFGEAPLIEDNSVKRDATTVFNAGLHYDFGAWETGLEVLNIFDAEDDDIAYYFESRLPGEPAPVADVHFHPVIPFSVRLSVRRKFGEH